MSKHYGERGFHQNEEWEDKVTHRITLILLFLFIVWMMVIAFRQPQAVDIMPPEHTINEAPTP